MFRNIEVLVKCLFLGLIAKINKEPSRWVSGDKRIPIEAASEFGDPRTWVLVAEGYCFGLKASLLLET
jgi:hypothetical protein